MKRTPAEERVVSVVLGVGGMLWLIALFEWRNELTAHEGLFWLGSGLTFISLALEPRVLFEPMSSSWGTRMSGRQPLVVAISSVGLVCMLLACLSWLAS
jgi:hypothetical protein